ncbi:MULTISPECIES: OprD family porin [unclassified Endozoicomonas]|uniref:OprD family porin n=1 Tax=unclassified Endozoicomonas TaxID=2644528 RepID=UPI0021489550|nr:MULTISPECIES: OprD family porin [unclassified Endozoicomonas]
MHLKSGLQPSALLASGLWTAAVLSSESLPDNSSFISNTALGGKLRTVYYDVHNTVKDSTLGAWTGGLSLDLSSSLGEVVGLGASFYSAVKLYMPEENAYSYQLLNGDNEGFSKLGQAYIEVKLPSTYEDRSVSFKAGRQNLRTGLISGSSSRTVPSNWNGYNLKGTIENLKIGLALVDQMSLRNQAGFHSLTNFSGEKIDYIIGAEAIYTLQFSHERELRLKYRNAFAKEFLQAHNGDILFTTYAGQNLKINLGGSYYQTQKSGRLWEGTGWGGSPLFDDKASVINLHGGLMAGSWHFRAGVSHFKAPSSAKASGTHYTPPGAYYYDFGANTHGTWDINTSGSAEDMLYDGETAWMMGLAYNFSESWLKGLKAGYAFYYGSGMEVSAPDGQKIAVAEREHDIHLVYAFPKTVLEGLKFKLKYGLYQNDKALRKAIRKEENDLRIWLDYDFQIF